MDLIKIEPTTSLAIPNGSATGGSVTSALVSRVRIPIAYIYIYNDSNV